MITNIWIVPMLLTGPSTRVPQTYEFGGTFYRRDRAWFGGDTVSAGPQAPAWQLGGSCSFPSSVLQYPLGRVDFAAPSVTIAGPSA